ncbi:F-box/SPRY domain-containing protein 1 [Hondaea fermentalgiana]|uniref:F-box/SPRY domain-containing protein 1 n=1 Tax=Hondaea fermentalgiana TaxID=2315210 RepID=A0A2R5GCL7_9STRA|nr:F-box/SPRY domain-containing protein 1 [Hondaea fermentalgiana]|eukprot:GBG28712.1 F-box/SPRY domain-containing protein 1 [Hondaea fermentalgiana]
MSTAHRNAAQAQEAAVPLRARPVTGTENTNELDQICEELAVLEVSKRFRGNNDLVESFLHATRCALFRPATSLAQEFDLFSLPDIMEIGSPKSILGPDFSEDLLQHTRALRSSSDDNAELPMNVRLGVEMFLRMIAALDLANNRPALFALLHKLPGILSDLPALALTDSGPVAREVHIDSQMRAAHLADDDHSMDNFQKRKAKIARELERRKRMSAAMIADAGIPTAVAAVLEDAYLGVIAMPQQYNKQTKQPRRPSSAQRPPVEVTSGELLSTWLGLSIKRGSLSGLATVIRILFQHASALEGPKRSLGLSRHETNESAQDDVEERKAAEMSSSVIGVADAGDREQDPQAVFGLLSQAASEDLDAEPFLRELAEASLTNVLRAFQPPEKGDVGGTLFTFGKGDHGKLGHGKCTEVDPSPQPHLHEHCPDGYCTENIKMPRMIIDLENATICKVASLSTHSVALSDEGVLYTWGNGDKNRLGHGTTAKEYYPRIVNSLLTRPPVVDIACGLGHTLALLENGHLYSWGNGGNGRLGLGDTDDRALACLVTKFITDPLDDKYLQEPVKQSAFEMPKGVRLVGLHCGASHSMAIAEDGRCFTWGKNNQGQCGHGDVADKLHPQLVDAFTKSAHNERDKTQEEEEEEEAKAADQDNSIRAMAGGWEHTLALTRDGRLFSFGSGYKDSRRTGLPPVLGHGGTERELRPRQIMALQSETIKYCTCGWDHSMAITDRGHVYTWGAGTNGKLGHGDEESHTLPRRIDSLVDANVRIVQVEAGCEHSVAVSDEGYLYTWGHGDSGRLGHESNRTEKRPKRVQSLVERGLPVLSIAVGDKYNLILTQSEAAKAAAESAAAAAAAAAAASAASADPAIAATESAETHDEPAQESKLESKENNNAQDRHESKQDSSLDTSTREAMSRGQLSEALLGLTSFAMPGDEDDLLPEWMLCSDRVALFVLAHLERLASGVSQTLSAAGMESDVAKSNSDALGADASSSAAPCPIYAPGFIAAWNRSSVESDDSAAANNSDSCEQTDAGSIFTSGSRPSYNEVALVAAAALQEGFREFYPSPDSRLGLLRYMLASSARARAEGESNNRVLDVLMSNLARDDAMQPLVAGMAASDFDVLTLLQDLLGNTHRPSHLQLLLAFQSHAFAVWSEPEFLQLRGVLTQFSDQVFRLAAADTNAAHRTHSFLTTVLPRTLSLLIVTPALNSEERLQLLPSVRALFARATEAEAVGDLALTSSQNSRLIARFCGRLLCQDLQTGLPELLRLAREIGHARGDLVAELTFYIPYASSWCGAPIVCGNPQLVGPARTEVSRSSLVKNECGIVRLEDAVEALATLVALDPSNSAQVALVSLLSANQARITAEQLETLLDAVLARYDNFVKDRGAKLEPPSTSSSTEKAMDTSAVRDPDQEQLWRTLLAIATTSATNENLCASETFRSRLIKWVETELQMLIGDLQAHTNTEEKMQKVLQGAAFVSSQLHGKHVPDTFPENAAQGGSEDDDLDNAVDKVLRGAFSDQATSASSAVETVSHVPPDPIASKSFAVSFWLRGTGKGQSPLVESFQPNEVRTVFARCQRRDNEDDGPMQSQHSLLQDSCGCKEHGVAAQPIVVLRRVEGAKGEKDHLVLEAFVSTILLHDAKRSTLLEFVSLKLDDCALDAWTHVCLSVDMAARTFTLRLNGNDAFAESKLRGQVLRKTSSSAAIRYGGWKGSADFNKAESEHCSSHQGCNLCVMSRLLGRGAPVTISDPLWHIQSLETAQTQAIADLGRAEAREARVARAELHASRLLQSLHVGTIPFDVKLAPMLHTLFASSRWLVVQQRVLMVLESVKDWDTLAVIFARCIQRRGESNFCWACQESCAAQPLALRQLAGYEPSARKEHFQDMVLAARERLLREIGEHSPAGTDGSFLCSACSNMNGRVDWTRALAHQATLHASLLHAARVAQKCSPEVAAQFGGLDAPAILDMYRSSLSGVPRENAVVLLQQSVENDDCDDRSQDKESAREQVLRGVVRGVFDAGRLMRTYCLQHEEQFLPYHASLFSAASNEAVYSFFVSDEAAIAALQVARLKGLFSTLDEPLSPKSPGSPTGRMPGKHANLSLWERHGAALVRRTTHLNEQDRDALLRLDFNSLCSPNASLPAVDSFGPSAWRLDKVVNIQLDEGFQQWIPVAQVGACLENDTCIKMDMNELAGLCEANLPSSFEHPTSMSGLVRPVQALGRFCGALRALCRELAAGSTEVASLTSSKASVDVTETSIARAFAASHEDLVKEILDVAVSGNETLASKLVKLISKQEGASPDVARVMRQVSGKARVSLRLLEAASLRLHERIRTENGSLSSISARLQQQDPQSQQNLGATTCNLEQAGHSLTQGSGPLTSTEPEPRLIRLESLGGEVQLDQENMRIQGLGDFSTVRLRQSRLSKEDEEDEAAAEALNASGLISLSAGKWYYEVVLLSDQKMQIGWANREFRVDGDQGAGVGNHPSSWAFDGSRQRRMTSDEATSYGLEEPWQIGDVVGCLLDMDARRIQYTLNGHDLGIAFSDFDSLGGLFPVLSFAMGQSARIVVKDFNFAPPSGFESIVKSLGSMPPRRAALRISSFQEDLDEIAQDIQFIQDTLRQDAPMEASNSQAARSNTASSPGARNLNENAQGAGAVQLSQSPNMDERRQRIIDALLATGLPMEWCRRAVDHVARDAQENGSSFDENAAISWVMDRMMQEDGQESLIRSMVLEGSGLGAVDGHRAHQESDDELAGAQDDAQLLAYEDALSGDVFGLETQTVDSPGSGGLPLWERVGTASYDEPTGAQARRRAISEGWTESPSAGFGSNNTMGSTPGDLTLSINVLGGIPPGSGVSGAGGKAVRFDRGELSVPALLQFVERARTEDLEACAIAVDSALAIEYARGVMVGLLGCGTPQVLRLASMDVWMKFFRLSLFRGITLFDSFQIKSTPVPHMGTSSYAVVRKALLTHTRDVEEQALGSEALKDLQRATKSAYASVAWGAVRGTKRYTLMSIICSDANYHPSLEHALGTATNGFRGAPHLMLSDEEALTQPSVELAVYLLSSLLDARARVQDLDPESSHLVSAETLSELVACLFCKNAALKDAIVRLCAKILGRVHHDVERGAASASWARDMLACVPTDALQRVFTKRLQKEEPFLDGTPHSAYVHGLLQLLVAVDSLDMLLRQHDGSAMKEHDTESSNGTDEDMLSSRGIKLELGHVTEDSILLTWATARSVFSNDSDGGFDSAGDHGGEEDVSSMPSSGAGIPLRRSGHNADTGSLRSTTVSVNEYGRDDEDEDDDRISTFGSFQASEVEQARSNSLHGGNAQSSERHLVAQSGEHVASGIAFRPDTVRVIEYAVGLKTNEWRVLAELPVVTQSYIMESAQPDTTYRFRMRLRSPDDDSEPEPKSPGSSAKSSRVGPVLQVDTLLQPVIMLSPEYRGPNLVLSGLNRTVKNTVNKKWNAVRCNVGFSRGLHTWDVHIDHCVSKNIFVGVCTKEASMDNYVGADSYGWAYLSNRAVWHNKSKLKSYGEVFREGDIIRVTLDCDARTLAFARNGADYGIAVEGLPSDVYYPAVSLYNEKDAVTMRFKSSETPLGVGALSLTGGEGTATATRFIRHAIDLEALLNVILAKKHVADLSERGTDGIDDGAKPGIPEGLREVAPPGHDIEDLLEAEWNDDQDRYLCDVLRAIGVFREHELSAMALDRVSLQELVACENGSSHTEEELKARACILLLLHEMLVECFALVEDFGHEPETSYENANSTQQSFKTFGPGAVFRTLQARGCSLFH